MQLSSRQNYLVQLSRDAGNALFDEEKRICLIRRDTIWYAIGLLFDKADERKNLGLELLRSTEPDDCTHTPATLIAVYHILHDIIPGDLRSLLKTRIEAALIPAVSVEWHDGNVNHPLAAYCTLICGGELCGEKWASEIGYRKLAHFRNVVGDRKHGHIRQAEMSEYNSPTYTALNLWFLALIAEYALDERAKRLALFLEQRLWINIALHFHAPTGQFAGPYSRAYHDDSVGGFSALHATLYAASDAEIFLNPDVSRGYEHHSNLVQNALIAIIPFHPPENLHDLLFNKSLPLTIKATTYDEWYHENSREGGFDPESYPGGWNDLMTYATPEYSLGTVGRQYVNGGQCDAFHLHIRSSERITSQQDFRSCFTRGIFNDGIAGKRYVCHTTGIEHGPDLLFEEGRCAVYQHENIAIVLYAPKRQGNVGVKSFRLDVIFSCFKPFTRLLLGNTPVLQHLAQSAESKRILFEDYHTFGAITPLAPYPKAENDAVRIWEDGPHLMVSFWNTAHPERLYSREELSRWRNGFVIELATREEYAGLEAFAKHIDASSLVERSDLWPTRDVTYTTGGNTMQFIYDPLREHIISRKWNDAEESVQHFAIEGFDDRDGVFAQGGGYYGKEEYTAFLARLNSASAKP